MQAAEAAKLQQQWKAKGSPPCEHPQLEREYHLSMNTGDKVCTTCGEDFSRPEWKQMGR
ncbi:MULTISPECIES: hypothetical protein [unclassified Streptomyces]|uniref:hypothetical protein n=1 Tax=Streptomyces TaxID=1883 RepID=UPI0013E2BBBD|nr:MULTISPECIES: hypothetical protein [unclassified Streptomyces]UQA35351.1 hypothetical protein KRR37_17700 [Streptomyces sp. HNA39]